MEATDSAILVAEVSDGICRVRLNRPAEGNTLTRALMRELAAAIRLAGADERVRVVVLEAAGRDFCRGRDGKGESRSGMTPHEVRVHLMGAVLDAYQAISDCPVPVVALVHGDAVGFGAALALSCDITLAAAPASFSFPEIEHGIPPTMAMCAALGKVPAKALSYLIFSGDAIDATAAVGFGLVSKVFPAAAFSAQCSAFISTLAGRPRLVVETIKRYQAKAAHLSPDMAAEYAGTLLALVRAG